MVYAVLGDCVTLPPVKDLVVGDEFSLSLLEGTVPLVLRVEDIYEAAPGVIDVAWSCSHPFSSARIEVEYDPRTGDADVTVTVYDI